MSLNYNTDGGEAKYGEEREREVEKIQKGGEREGYEMREEWKRLRGEDKDEGGNKKRGRRKRYRGRRGKRMNERGSER